MINPVYKGELILNRHCRITEINKIDLTKAVKIATMPIVSKEKWDIAQARLSNNKHLKATDDGLFILQGLIKCGLCGCSYRAERMGGGRYYCCRGQLKTVHLDGSPRCKNRNIRAEGIERAILKRLDDVVNDPKQAIIVLKDAIEKQKRRESELESRLLPIEKRLKEIAEMKSRLADKFIIDNMDTDKYNAARQNLEKEELRLMSLRRESDPNQLAELESIRAWIKRHQELVDITVFDLEDETKEESVKLPTMQEPHEYLRDLIVNGNRKLSEERQLPITSREWLDLLQLQLVVFKDKIEVKASIPLPDIQAQECVLTEGDRG